jgi:hypothetical protein
MKLLGRIFGLLTTLWILYTLYSILRFGGAVVLDPDTTSRIMGVNNSGVVVSSVGLTYHGLAGAVLVITQVLVVGAALIGALFLAGRRRLIAMGVLVAWTGVWFGNAMWLRSHGWQHGTSTIGMAVALVLGLGWMLSVAVQARSS